jgi:hypothetical protein
MKITISKTKPTTKPIREYETCFIYVGFRFRYDTHGKKISSIMKDPGGEITYYEESRDTTTFSRAYSTENVRVIVYSDSPKVWCEEISPNDYHVFTEVTPSSPSEHSM